MTVPVFVPPSHCSKTSDRSLSTVKVVVAICGHMWIPVLSCTYDNQLFCSRTGYAANITYRRCYVGILYPRCPLKRSAVISFTVTARAHRGTRGTCRTFPGPPYLLIFVASVTHWHNQMEKEKLKLWCYIEGEYRCVRLSLSPDHTINDLQNQIYDEQV